MTHEIDWLTASELAGICGTDAFALREMLETAGLADGPEPSGLAMRHGFAEPSTEEAGRPSTTAGSAETKAGRCPVSSA